jgi:3-deoxy-D-manno-octulosonic-acid transferase
MSRTLYSLLLRLAVPVALGWLAWRGLYERAYWQAWAERLGCGDTLDQDSIWLHAVSLGEVSASAPLVRALRTRFPQARLVLTTATPTGRARARTLFADADVRYVPYDTPGAVERFMRRIHPRLAVVMETELWPNLYEACRRQGVPLLLANARLSAKSVRRYRRLGALVRTLFSTRVTVAAQTEEDAGRFVSIGAAASQVCVAGNIKFDVDLGEAVAARGRALRAGFGPTRPVWVAGSTHAGEDEQVLSAQRMLMTDRPDALLVLAPRHPERFESVAELLRRRELRFARRSAAIGAESDMSGVQVFLLDAVGELASYYAAADVAFVGGSLVPIGGHNLLEPAALGVPVLTGPSHANARDVARLLLAQGAAVEVADAQSLAAILARLFADPAERGRIGAQGRKIVAANRGAVARVLALIDQGTASG